MPEDITFKYVFVFIDGKEKKFDIRLDGKTLDMTGVKKAAFPEWTKLDFYKCANCPLDASLHEHCPVAASLTGLVESFGDSVSYEKVDVFVECAERKYMKSTALHEGLSSIVGIHMVTNGCPVMEKLKPMVRFHLPFATEEETVYRVFSMYSLAQYYIHKWGGEPDFKLENLVKAYDEIRTVNKHFARRLANIRMKDASLNALVTLDCFAMLVIDTLSHDVMEDMSRLFSVYRNDLPLF